ncbi:MAG: c-type cytochrome [Thermoleophilaceae bacterium]
MRRGVLIALAVLCAAGALAASAPGAPAAPGPPAAGSGSQQDPVARGRGLFVEACSSCHGLDARGVPGRGPNLHGAGAAAADFYLSTGRMPAPVSDAEPLRAKPAYGPRETAALVAYVASLGPGPPVPDVQPARGDVGEGLRLYTDRCAGCHQIAGAGGIVTGASVPSFKATEPRQVGEAIRVGPHLMPKWSERAITPSEVDSIAAYVELTKDPVDAGGWGIGHIGPIPEGMVAWLLGGVALLVVIRLIGERMPR